QATTNETNSTIKTYLDNWYGANIHNTKYKDYISDTLFCNDRQLQSEVGGAATGTGFGHSATNYASYYRLNTNKTPSLFCGLKNDRFTVSNVSIGNGALTYPVGLITIDELSLAGMVYNISNSTNYLYTNQCNWSMSPYCKGSSSTAYVWFVLPSGDLRDLDVDETCEVRPTINLKPNTIVTGYGDPTNPYVVQ
ncbi:MAG: hypothetical protein PHD03_03640, partial [Bacilli bacterium]|nr:hypothetical protein [Bacilli bacterium]